MASLELPADYDAIVLGSGMTECIVAAALSRIGYNVLHLDRNDYYSGDWACFNWKGLQDWIESKADPEKDRLLPKEVDLKSLLKDSESVISLEVNSSSVSSVKQSTFVQERPVLSAPAQDAESPGSDSCEAESRGAGNDEETPVNEKGTGGTKQSEKLEAMGQPGECVTHGEELVQSSEGNELAVKCEDRQSSDVGKSEGGDNSAGDTDPSCEAEAKADSERDDCDNKESESLQSEATGEERQPCTVSAVESVPKQERQYYLDDISSQWRKFNLDLMPKVLYCRGPMVELLISSDVAKYCEFKTISRVLTFTSGKLEPVPCSRSDVFSSKQVSMIEKRMMMKFLQFAISYSSQPEEYEGCEDVPFCEYLRSKKLTENVCHYIQHAIAMVNDHAKTVQGLESCKRFLESLGRYGNTAFLWPVYGSGELPQCFCRMCAVFGGCYCLRRTGSHVIIDAENKCTGIIDTEGQRLNCKWLIMESSYAPLTHRENTPVKKTSRAIFLTDRSILPNTDREDITQMSYPRAGDRGPITLYEVGHSAYACPKDMFIVHLTCTCDDSPEKDFEEIVSKLFRPQREGDIQQDDPRPRILWQLYFEMVDSNGVEYPECPSGVYIVPGPDAKMDFEESIKKARDIFTTLCPEEEFLPKAPNPEDIIWNDGA